MKFKIDKNIPMPAIKHGNAKYPFDEMEVGDSILVKGVAAARSCKQAAYKYGKQNGKKFAARAAANGARIWRTQ